MIYRSKGEKESVLMSLRTAGMTSSRLRYFLDKQERVGHNSMTHPLLLKKY